MLLENAKANVFHYNITDHSTVVFSIEFNSEQNERKFFNKQTQRKKINFRNLLEKINSVDWNEVFSKQSVSEAFESFFETLHSCIAQSEEHKHLNKQRVRLKPWTTEHLAYRINKRKKIY